MTVFLVAASAAARDRLREALRTAGVRVSGETASIRHALRSGGVDAVILPDADLVELRENPGTDIPVPLVVLSDEGRIARTLHDLAPPGWAVLPWEADGEELRAAVRLVASGLVVMPLGVVEAAAGHEDARLSEGDSDGEDDEMPQRETLTAREREVLERLADGLSNREIAAALGISDHTAKFHVASVLAKLGAANRAEAVRQGLRRGLLTV
jgi:DNA-binding NarL/FixJ family response regulator